MNIRAIAAGVVVFFLLTLAVLSIALVFGVQTLTAPQLMTLSCLWLSAGYTAAWRAGEAGILHGLLATLIGMVLVILCLWLTAGLVANPLLSQLTAGSFVRYLILAAFWGAAGGMIADIVRMMRWRRETRRRDSAPGDDP